MELLTSERCKTLTARPAFGDLMSTINGARESILLLSYQKILPQMMKALLAAASKPEVSIHLIVDKKSTEFEGLRSSFPPTSKISINPETVEGGNSIMHVKTLVVDKRKVAIGSWNFTHSGMAGNIELGVMGDDRDLAMDIIAWVEAMHKRGVLTEIKQNME